MTFVNTFEKILRDVKQAAAVEEGVGGGGQGCWPAFLTAEVA